MADAIKHLAVSEIKSVLVAGGGATVSAGQFSTTELKSLATTLRGNAVLHVVNSQALSATEMKSIATAATAPAHVCFSGRAD